MTGQRERREACEVAVLDRDCGRLPRLISTLTKTNYDPLTHFKMLNSVEAHILRRASLPPAPFA